MKSNAHYFKREFKVSTIKMSDDNYLIELVDKSEKPLDESLVMKLIHLANSGVFFPKIGFSENSNFIQIVTGSVGVLIDIVEYFTEELGFEEVEE